MKRDETINIYKLAGKIYTVFSFTGISPPATCLNKHWMSLTMLRLFPV